MAGEFDGIKGLSPLARKFWGIRLEITRLQIRQSFDRWRREQQKEMG